jgi:hypothetical protein
MNKSKSKYYETEEQIRKKIIYNTMLYNDNRKNFVNDSPSKLLIAYQREQHLQNAKEQTDRNMKFKLEQL